jgi:hypothetical protein
MARLASDALTYGENNVACTREGGGVLVGRGSASFGARGWFSGASFSWGAGVRSLGRWVQPFEHDLDKPRGFSWRLASLVAGRGELIPIEKELGVPVEAEEVMVEVAVVMVEVSPKIGY